MTFSRKFRRFIKRVKRMIAWNRLLWKTDIWDYADLVKIMKFQMEQMRDYTVGYHRKEEWVSLNNAIQCCDEILKDDWNTDKQAVKDLSKIIKKNLLRWWI